MLGSVNIAGGRTKRSVNHDLKRLLWVDHEGDCLVIVWLVGIEVLIQFVGPMADTSDVDTEVVGILGS